MCRMPFVLLLVAGAFLLCVSFAALAHPSDLTAASPDPDVASAGPASAGSGLDAVLQRKENERRDQAATMEAVTLFVQATGKMGVTRGSGLALPGGYILTLGSVVGDDDEALLFTAGEALPPSPARLEAREERNGRRTGSDFVLLRFTPPPSFVPPTPVFADARRGDGVTAWGCAGIPQARREETSEGTAHVYIPPPPIGSEGRVLSAPPGELLRHSALPAAGAAGGPLTGRGRTLVGLTLGAPEADDGNALSASARPASAMIEFLRAHGVISAFPPPAGKDAAPASENTGGSGASASVPAPAPENAKGSDASAQVPENMEASDDPETSSATVDGSGDPTARVAALLCGLQREDREKGAALLRGLVSRRDADPESLALFAWALRAGLLADADEHEAPAAAEKAAKAGSSLGKAILGLLYRDARLLPADPRKARALAEEAAAEGETLGVSLLALSEYGDGAPDSPREVLRGAEKAAAAGDAAAMGLAACLYALHEEFTYYRKAEKRARAAADYGDGLGLYILARLYKDGTVTERDPAKAWACAQLSLDGEGGPHREDRNALFLQLDGQITDQEKEKGRRILQTLLLNRLPGYAAPR
jgi:TPR repeat protein